MRKFRFMFCTVALLALMTVVTDYRSAQDVHTISILKKS